ncbi:tetratricopeptide repeat protein [Faucicola boevrei]|uniref:tetratricopeptide repeat protein n=1 Tax=Faucicola boevrei TaxID=346665 RepID=UPI00037F664D|nr:tetratricopeptide repeat protein [Moraxella boevrei]
MKKFFKATLLASVLGFSGVASADLVANIPLDSSRFDIMPVKDLITQAKSGNQQAQFFLAKRYHKGIGTQQDFAQAIQWYTTAAKQDIAPAQLNLAMMYIRGEGVKPNAQQARYWLEKAAKLGDNRASYTLAMLDEKDKKLVDAYKWYDLASRDGMLSDQVRSKAQSKISQLALNLSTQDIATARSRADSWFQSK